MGSTIFKYSFSINFETSIQIRDYTLIPDTTIPPSLYSFFFCLFSALYSI
jgi:hypothetical protein